MQPTLRHVPPRASSPAEFFHPSMQAVLNPSCAARTAAMYPPGPAPITTPSNSCAMFFLFDPEARDGHAQAGAEAGGERRDVLEEERRVLEHAQHPESHGDRHPDRD